jgi:hypothetical protein
MAAMLCFIEPAGIEGDVRISSTELPNEGFAEVYRRYFYVEVCPSWYINK